MDRGSIAINAQGEEVSKDGTTSISGFVSPYADVVESYRFSQHPQRPDKCSGGGSFDFLREMSPGSCGCRSQKQLSPREILSQLAVHHERIKRQGTHVAGTVMLSTVPCPTDCGTASFGAVYFCLKEIEACGKWFQNNWWWRHIILYWNCPGENYYTCAGSWHRDPEEDCCQWANGDVLPPDCISPGGSYKKCTMSPAPP